MSSICKKISLALLLLCSGQLYGQNTKRVLFLGNSYTDVNNLPQLVSDIALSTGKTLSFAKNAPGSYYLADHLTNPVSLAEIAAGNWDNVVLQDQSMALAYPWRHALFLPYGRQLDSLIKAGSRCAQTMFYSTWGRKNGDTYYCTPPYCDTDMLIVRTYYEMDSVIETNYKIIADSLKAGLTPVGAVWRYIRRHHPSIVLFQADESHPSLAGSYAAACSFYTTLFRSDPVLITFNPGLPAGEAAAIRDAAGIVVYHHLTDWNVGVYDSLLDSSCFPVPVGIRERNAHSAGWSVFPNPATDILYVRWPADPGTGKIRLYNTLGELVREANAAGAGCIGLRGLPPGLYFARTSAGEPAIKVWKK